MDTEWYASSDAAKHYRMVLADVWRCRGADAGSVGEFGSSLVQTLARVWQTLKLGFAF